MTPNDKKSPLKTHHSISNEYLSPSDQFQGSANMSQPSLNEKFEDEQFLSTALAIELEDVKKTLTQLKVDKSKSPHKGPFSLNVDYYFKKNFKELDSIGSRLEKLESREQPRDWNL